MNEEKVDLLVSTVQTLNSHMRDMSTGMKNMEENIKDIDAKLSELEREVKNIQITLENVTNHNIRMIAEGHIDLDRRLDDALRITHEKELLVIRVNVLEDEVKRIKDRLTA